MDSPSVAYVLCRIEDDSSNGSSTTRVASFREGRIGYREWATRSGRINPSLEDRYDHDVESSWHEIVAATIWRSYEERTCSRCFEGRVFDIQRGAWVACERCSGSGWVVVYVYPKLKRRPR